MSHFSPTLDVSEAVARRQPLGLSVLNIGKRVIAGLHADELIRTRIIASTSFRRSPPTLKKS
jgi:hypothetical protein